MAGASIKNPFATAPPHPPPTPVTKLPTIKFDDAGDLWLTVGKVNTQDILVDSKALCRSSRVFKKMLSGKFVEAKPAQGEWRVKLPDDNPAYFAVLMDMIHLQYERTPDRPSMQLLYNVLRMTNKYDMARVLRPVGKKWADMAYAKWTNSDSPDKLKMFWLVISWELGHREMFLSVAKEIGLGCRVDQNGHLIGANCQPFKTSVSDTSEMIEPLTTYRDSCMGIVYDECRTLGERLLSGHPICNGHKSRGSQYDCHSMKLGRLLTRAHNLEVSELFVGNDSGHFTCSVKTILNTLEDIGKVMVKDGHKDCDHMAATRVAIRRRIDKMPGPQTKWHLDQLAVRAVVTKVQEK